MMKEYLYSSSDEGNFTGGKINENCQNKYHLDENYINESNET